jgi:hypothetical protein
VVSCQDEEGDAVRLDLMHLRRRELCLAFVDGALWREVVAVYTTDDTRLELVDEVLGNELSDVSHARETLDQHGRLRFYFRYLGYLYFVHLVLLLYSPYASSGENLGGAVLSVSAPHSGQVSRSA